SANGLTIQGRLQSRANTAFLVDIYSNPRTAQVSSTGFGQGESYLGTIAVDTDAAGRAEFSAVFTVDIPDGDLITATATDSAGNTSEFSARLAVGEVLPSVFVVNTTDDVDDGIADAEHTSLREAIHGANNHPGPDLIRFNIPGSGVQTIVP